LCRLSFGYIDSKTSTLLSGQCDVGPSGGSWQDARSDKSATFDEAENYSFSTSSQAFPLLQVPYEDLPFLFFGEEQYMLARIFTHGYDLFSPPCSVAYHLYSRAHRETFQSSVPLVSMPSKFHTTLYHLI
jgi:hypothetical protein